MVEKYEGNQETGSKQQEGGGRQKTFSTPETSTGLLVLAAPSAYDIVCITHIP